MNERRGRGGRPRRSRGTAPSYGATTASWGNHGEGAIDSIGIADAGAEASPPGLWSERVGMRVAPELQAAAAAARATIARNRFSITTSGEPPPATASVASGIGRGEWWHGVVTPPYRPRRHAPGPSTNASRCSPLPSAGPRRSVLQEGFEGARARRFARRRGGQRSCSQHSDVRAVPDDMPKEAGTVGPIGDRPGASRSRRFGV
jgi:hypothetical protein